MVKGAKGFSGQFIHLHGGTLDYGDSTGQGFTDIFVQFKAGGTAQNKASIAVAVLIDGGTEHGEQRGFHLDFIENHLFRVFLQKE